MMRCAALAGLIGVAILAGGAPASAQQRRDHLQAPPPLPPPLPLAPGRGPGLGQGGLGQGEDLTVGPGPQRCDPNRWLEHVLDSGAIVELDDGSRWQVDELDHSIAVNWQDDAPITACADQLINREEHETARARRTVEGDVGG